ncbi:hypothetical protein FORC087_271 (plasmid) [Bacillus cereus]|nr:hypothetical protein FORC087_271 [Bacillus cereus]
MSQSKKTLFFLDKLNRKGGRFFMNFSIESPYMIQVTNNYKKLFVT